VSKAALREWNKGGKRDIRDEHREVRLQSGSNKLQRVSVTAEGARDRGVRRRADGNAAAVWRHCT
jgi:hypothetical protein